MTPLPALRSAADDNAARAAYAALAAAIKSLDAAHKNIDDARLDDLIAGITEALANAQGDLAVLAHQIHDDEHDARAVLRWAPRYAAA
jgi:cob(I)alamin adenosyltransferase